MSFKGFIEYGAYQAPDYFLTQSSFNAAQEAPLDGVVVKTLDNDGDAFDLKVWDSTSYPDNYLSTSKAKIANRYSIGWGRLRYNFAHVYLGSSGPFDSNWFGQNVSNLIDNLDLIGRYVSDSGLYGIWLDVEAYDGKIWTYSNQTDSANHSFAEYKAQVYSVAREIAARWRDYNPDINIMLTECYYGYVEASPPQESSEWGLLGSFLDGLYDEFGYTKNKKGQAAGKLIDTTEASYGCLTGACITYGINRVNGSQGASYRGNSSYFGQVDAYGLALWIDKPSFDPATPNANYFTPTTFKTSLGYIADGCDWAWIYNSDYHLYSGTSVGNGYIQALRDFRVERGLL